MAIKDREVVTDSLGHVIPEEKLDKRVAELSEVKELLRLNQDVILTADSNCDGKTTFAKILRAEINNGYLNAFQECIYTEGPSVDLEYRISNQRRTNKGLDIVSYRHLLAFNGLVIFDEVYPEHQPLIGTLRRSKHLLLVQPNFLDGPPYDDTLHEDFDRWLNETQPPIYKLPRYNKV